MAAPTWTQTIDNMFTSTWAYRKNPAVEQVYDATPFWYWMNAKGKVQDVTGYRRIEIPLEYGENETVKWIGKGDTVDLTEGELLTMCYEDWKYVAVNIMRFGVEVQQNKGQARLIDYVGRKINRAEYALRKNFESVFFANGTGDKEPNGLQNLIANTPTSGTVHGLSRTTYPWWRNQYKASSGVTSIYLISDMRTCFNDFLKYDNGSNKNIFMVTTQSIFEAYEDELLEYQKYQTTELLEKGFITLNFKGRPMMWSTYAPSSNMYFINPEYLYIVKDPDYFMDMTEWKPIPDQVNDRTAQIVCAIQMCCSRPIAQSVMTGITVG